MNGLARGVLGALGIAVLATGLFNVAVSSLLGHLISTPRTQELTAAIIGVAFMVFAGWFQRASASKALVGALVAAAFLFILWLRSRVGGTWVETVPHPYWVSPWLWGVLAGLAAAVGSFIFHRQAQEPAKAGGPTTR
jgi:hypothetical protein